MIFLKILLWIVLAVLGIILLILFIPVSAEIAYIDKKLTYKTKYGFINLYDSDGNGIAVKFINKSDKSEKKETKEISDDSADFEMPEQDKIYEDAETDIEDVENEDTTEPEIKATESSDEFSDTEEKHKNKKKSVEKSEKSEGAIEKLFNMLDKYESRIDIALDMFRSADRPVLYMLKGFRFSKIYIDFVIADEDAYKCALDYGKISGTVYNLIGWVSTVFTAKFKTVDIFPDFKQKESRWDISSKLSFRLITPIVAGLCFLITYIFRFFIPQKMQERKLKKSRKSRK